MGTPKTIARIAGLLYLALTLTAVVNLVYGPAHVVEPGNPSATAEGIRAAATLFRIGFVSNVVSATLWLLTAMALYALLRHVQPAVAAAMVVFVAVGVAISLVGLLNQYAALTVATGDLYPRTLGRAGADALATRFIDHPAPVDAVFFGLWLLPLAWLAVRSGYVPRILGVLLVIGCAGYLANVLTTLLAPNQGGLAGLVLLPGPLSEFVLIGWLLSVGMRSPKAVPRPDPPVPPRRTRRTRART